MKTLSVLLVLLSVVATTVLPARAAEGLTPHEATYALELLEAEAGANTSVSGFYLVRVDSTCDAHRITTFLDMQLSNIGGIPVVIQDTYSVTEAVDGKTLSFETRQTVNGNLVQVLEGTADKSADGSGRVEFASPNDKPDLDLPPGVRFPYEAIEGTIQGQRDGSPSVEQLMFDPSVGDLVLVVDLFVGKPTALSEPPNGDADLLTGVASRVVTSFYERDVTDAEPMTTAIVDMFPNGVSQRAVFDMGQVSVLASLTDIRRLPPPDCS